HAVYVISKSGELVMEMKAEGENSRGGEGLFLSLFKLKNGKIAAASYSFSSRSSEQVYLTQIPNLENNEIEEITIPLMGTDSNGFFTTGGQADLLLCTNAGFYDYDLESGQQSIIFNALKYGITANSLHEVTILSDESIAIADWLSGKMRLARYVPYEPSEEDEPYEEIEKQALVLSTIEVDQWLSEYVADFNRINRYHHLEVRDYSDGGRIDEDDALTRFHLDLISGNFPDIIKVSRFMPSNSYISKGIYADLNLFIENDSSFNKADYLPGLFEAMEADGKLYEIFPIFMLRVIYGKTADVGTEIGWTLDEFAAVLDANPDARYIIDTKTKGSFISDLVLESFVNPHTGKINFDRDEFVKILSVAERFPDTIPPEVDLAFIDEGVKVGDPLLWQTSVMQFFDMMFMENLSFQDKVTLKGSPSPYGNGLSFFPYSYFGITEQAKNPEGAWEFLKFTLDYFDYSIPIFLPVKLSLLDEQIEKDEKHFNDPDSFKYNPPGSKRPGSTFSEIGADKIMEAIKATSKVRRTNNIISNIISEEVDSYLGGQKSADSVADIIENRIGIYLAEQE
ncbi:MAG: extracellular solute-binding protein, partial [Lachnospiraceae bacterium]|nr:extracellular solute-binding protein [Lachnospiraceae bacterium]